MLREVLRRRVYYVDSPLGAYNSQQSSCFLWHTCLLYFPRLCDSPLKVLIIIYRMVQNFDGGNF